MRVNQSVDVVVGAAGGWVKRKEQPSVSRVMVVVEGKERPSVSGMVVVIRCLLFMALDITVCSGPKTVSRK